MDWDNRPNPFKVYSSPDLETVPLPEPSAREVPALEALTARPESGRAPDLAALARLLTHGAGVIPHRTRGPFVFRTYAAAGALYPVEVYVVTGDIGDLAAGAYHFQPRSGSLTLLRPGDHHPHLVRATAEEDSVRTANLVIALTGIPWRTAWKYTERGYRHLFWDAGMILANLLALAASDGLAARVVLGFDDDEVEAVLGLDETREFPLCLLSIGSSEAVEAAPAPLESSPIPAEPLSRRDFEFPPINQVHDAGRLERPRVAQWRSGASDGHDGSSTARGESRRFAETDALEGVITRRGSARRFGPAPLPSEILTDTLSRAMSGIRTDYAPDGSALVEPFVIVNNVEGLEAGSYVWEGGELRPLQLGDFRREAGHLCLDQPLGATSGATIFLMTRLGWILERFDDRGYRAAQLEAGIVGGKIYLASYAHRFGATGLTFFDDEVGRFFLPRSRGLECMLVVAVGDSPRLKGRRLTVASPAGAP
jgi:SagB-type dehydrogenase family enzyme